MAPVKDADDELPAIRDMLVGAEVTADPELFDAGTDAAFAD